MDLFGSICLSDIPKHLIETSQKNGKKYLTICINELKNGEDKFGNTHLVKVYKKHDPADQETYYIGNMKPSKYNQGGNNADNGEKKAGGTNVPKTEENAPAAENAEDNDSDLPF